MKTKKFSIIYIGSFIFAGCSSEDARKGIFRVVNWMAKRICRFRCKVTQLLQEQ